MITITGFQAVREIVSGPIEEPDFLVIVDHGNGTWSAIGPAERITMVSGTQFQLEDANTVPVDANTYKVASDGEPIP